MAEGQDHGFIGRSVARLHDANGRVVGAGLVIGPGLVATCAHVVAAAAGGDPEAEQPPAGTPLIDFPLAGVGAPVPATVRRWSPMRADGSGDIAVLALATPSAAPVRVPPLRRVPRPWGHPFRAFGFPDGMTDGVWASGTVLGEQGTRWVQLQGADGGQPITGGFSGAPVWDERAMAVIGITVAVAANPSVRTAYLIPVEQVLGIDPELLPNPYRGLEPFGEQHAEFFHGRDEDITRLRDAVARRPIVAVLGQSGTGKSSLVRAGLLPALRAGGARIAHLRPLPNVPARLSFAVALTRLRFGELDEAHTMRRASELVARLTAEPAGTLRGLAGELGGRPGSVLFLDQFEELVAEDPAAAKDLWYLLAGLVAAGGSAPPRVVATLRWELVGELLAEDTADVFDDAIVPLAPMGRGQLRAAIVRPAESAPGLYFESGLVERILDDAGAEPGQLPLVESLLSQLWAQREGGYVTVAAYEWLGGVSGAVTKGAERALAEFVGPGEPELLRKLFTMLARPDGSGFSRRPVPLNALAPGVERLAQRLARGRLVVIGNGADGTAVVELAHQALIEHWPRLREWLAADLDFLRWRDEMDQQLSRWQVAGRDSELLLRGKALAGAEGWVGRRGGELTGAQRDFVRAGRRHRIRRRVAVAAAAAGVVVATAVATVIVTDQSGESGANSQAAAGMLPAPPPSGPAAAPPTSSAPVPTGQTSLPPGTSAPSPRPSPIPPPAGQAPPGAPVPDPVNCPAGKFCLYEQPGYQGEPRVYDIDHATGSRCRDLPFTIRSVFSNAQENQYIYLNPGCAGQPDLVPYGKGRPDVYARAYKHT